MDLPAAPQLDPARSTIQLVELDASAFAAKRVRVAIPGGTSFIFDRAASEQLAPGALVWRGTNRDDRGVFVVRGSSIAATFTAGGSTYQLLPYANRMHLLVRLDYSAFPPEHPAEFRAIETKPVAPGPMPFGARADAAPPTIEVLVAYTAAVKSAWSDPDGMIALAIAEANSANRSSEVRATFHLAYATETAYTESRNWQLDLDRLTGKTDGFLDDLHQLRDQHHADVVVLILDNPTACGLSAAVMATEATAFAAVHYSCVTGNYSLAHEIGHVMGARHDPDSDPASTPYSYGHGFTHLKARDGDSSWRTIMAYQCAGGCQRLQYWSSPSVEYNGVDMGTTKTHDVARVLNETASRVAGFRN